MAIAGRASEAADSAENSAEEATEAAGWAAVARAASGWLAERAAADFAVAARAGRARRRWARRWAGRKRRQSRRAGRLRAGRRRLDVENGGEAACSVPPCHSSSSTCRAQLGSTASAGHHNCAQYCAGARERQRKLRRAQKRLQSYIACAAAHVAFALQEARPARAFCCPELSGAIPAAARL